MSRSLLNDAREQAARAEPAVKGPALLHIARVLATLDPAEAEKALAEGLSVIVALPDDAREVLIGEAAAVAATVSPARAFQILPAVSLDREAIVSRVLTNMLEHGHVTETVAYLSDPPPHEPYPFMVARMAIGRTADDHARLRMLRAAMRAMRDPHLRGRAEPGGRQHLFDLFTFNWRRLPATEAKAIVRDLVASIQSEPDTRMTGGYAAGSHRIEFSSTHEHRLFQILGPLRHLEPDLADSVVKGYPDLSLAAAQFPYGRASMEAAASAGQPERPTEGVACPPQEICVGRRMMSIAEAIRTEFGDGFAAALQEYAIDTDPARGNDAPRVCWPSAPEFRRILYSAGKHEGHAAARYLDRIPDLALRLFAQIELAAALAGLPQLGSRTMRPGPGGFGEMMRARRQRSSPESRSSGPRPPAAGGPLPSRKPNLPASRELHISLSNEAADGGVSGAAERDFVDIRNVPLGALVGTLYDMPDTRIDWPSSVNPDQRYDIALVLPDRDVRDAIMQLLQSGLAKHFGWRVAREPRPKDVYVLTAPHGIKARRVDGDPFSGQGSFGLGVMTGNSVMIGGPLPMTADGHPQLPPRARVTDILDRIPDGRSTETPHEAFAAMRSRFARLMAAPLGPGNWIGAMKGSLTIAELCEAIEQGLDRPLLDETHLAGTYAIDVPGPANTTLAFLQTLCQAEGLVVSPGRRDVLSLVVSVA